jgi:hypothetical protein
MILLIIEQKSVESRSNLEAVTRFNRSSPIWGAVMNSNINEFANFYPLDS